MQQAINRKKIAVYLPPKLFEMADGLARSRLTSVSAIARQLLFDAVTEAADRGEVAIPEPLDYPQSRVHHRPAHRPHKTQELS